MPSVDRESSHDRELVKHQNSFSDIKGNIPMYVDYFPLEDDFRGSFCH